ncbi:hypothetical protein KJ885_05160 [Patescibacteria group bacterium]|nr:hypothetical protein [Patescibacteria group bacterium]
MNEQQMKECFECALSLVDDEQLLLATMMDMAVHSHTDPNTFRLPSTALANFMKVQDLLDIITKAEQFTKEDYAREILHVSQTIEFATLRALLTGDILRKIKQIIPSFDVAEYLFFSDLFMSYVFGYNRYLQEEDESTHSFLKERIWHQQLWEWAQESPQNAPPYDFLQSLVPLVKA